MKRKRRLAMFRKALIPLMLALFFIPGSSWASDQEIKEIESPRRLFDLDVGVGLWGIHGQATVYLTEDVTLEGIGNVFIDFAAYSLAVGHPFELYNDRDSDGSGMLIDLSPSAGVFRAQSLTGNLSSSGRTIGVLAQASLGFHYYLYSHLGWHARLMAGAAVVPKDTFTDYQWYGPRVALTTGPSF